MRPSARSGDAWTAVSLREAGLKARSYETEAGLKARSHG